MNGHSLLVQSQTEALINGSSLNGFQFRRNHRIPSQPLSCWYSVLLLILFFIWTCIVSTWTMHYFLPEQCIILNDLKLLECFHRALSPLSDTYGILKCFISINIIYISIISLKYSQFCFSSPLQFECQVSILACHSLSSRKPKPPGFPDWNCGSNCAIQVHFFVCRSSLCFFTRANLTQSPVLFIGSLLAHYSLCNTRVDASGIQQRRNKRCSEPRQTLYSEKYKAILNKTGAVWLSQ